MVMNQGEIVEIANRRDLPAPEAALHAAAAGVDPQGVGWAVRRRLHGVGLQPDAARRAGRPTVRPTA